jgi:deoxyadenosine/deoxycytidine kinase
MSLRKRIKKRIKELERQERIKYPNKYPNNQKKLIDKAPPSPTININQNVVNNNAQVSNKKKSWSRGVPILKGKKKARFGHSLLRDLWR